MPEWVPSVIRRVPIDVLAGFVGDKGVLEQQQLHFPCAVPVDGGVAVAVPEPDVPGCWALVVFDPGRAAAAAARVLGERGVPTFGTTRRFAFPIIADPNQLLKFTAGLRLSGHPMRGGWTLADERSSSVLVLAGPGHAITVTWWDEHGGLPFAYPVAIAEHRPSELECALARQWGGLPLHDFTKNDPYAVDDDPATGPAQAT
jgi:hypothetical protein